MNLDSKENLLLALSATAAVAALVNFYKSRDPLEKSLGHLPEIRLGACKGCGSNEWTMCNTKGDDVVDCNKCGGYPGFGE